MDAYEQAYLEKQANQDPREKLLKKAEKKIRDARIILIIIGALMIISSLALYFLNKFPLGDTLFNAIYGSLFFVLALLVKKYPKPVTAIGIAMYAIKIGMGILIDPSTAFQGIFIRIIFFAALIAAYKAADEVARLRNELGLLDEKELIDQPIDRI